MPEMTVPGPPPSLTRAEVDTWAANTCNGMGLPPDHPLREFMQAIVLARWNSLFDAQTEMLALLAKVTPFPRRARRAVQRGRMHTYPENSLEAAALLSTFDYALTQRSVRSVLSGWTAAPSLWRLHPAPGKGNVPW